MEQRYAMLKGAGLNVPLFPLHKSGNRLWRWVSGIAYLDVGVGEQAKNFTVELNAENTSARKHYDDPANRLHRDDLGDRLLDKLVGKPFRAEHGNRERYGSGNLGVIDSARMDSNNRLLVSGRIYGDTPKGLNVVADIDNGVLGSLSVKWQTYYNRRTGKVLGKEIVEISVCNRPHYPGCVLTTACSQPASKSGKYSTTDDEAMIITEERTALFTMSASEQQPASQPPQSAPSRESAAPPSNPANTSPHPNAAPYAQTPAAVIQQLTQSYAAESAKRNEMEAQLKAVQQELSKKTERWEAQQNKLKEKALEPIQDIVSQLTKHSGLESLSPETIETIARIMTMPLEDTNQQLDQVITACCAKLTSQELLIDQQNAARQRVDEASDSATLTMAASEAARHFGVRLGEPERQSRSGAPTGKPGTLDGTSLPASFYGSNWGSNGGVHSPASCLSQKLAQATNVGVHEVQHASAAPPSHAQFAHKQTRMVETAASHRDTEQSGHAAMMARIKNMSSQRSRGLVQTSTHRLDHDEQLPAYSGDRFN